MKNETPIEVAVLSAYRQRFDDWVKENKKEGERYHCIMNFKDTDCRTFNKIEYTYQWWRMDDCSSVKRSCELRLINIK
jgi:hypothetical protein